jgi:hypothetical protein
VSGGDVVIQNPDVMRLNQAITSLVARTAPPSKSVTLLYDRWVTFTSSPYYRALPDTSLFPVYQAFATAYKVIGIAHGVKVQDVDPRLLVLASGDGSASIERVGRALDQTLEAAKKGGSAVAGAIWKPLALVAGTALAIGFARRGGSFGRRR